MFILLQQLCDFLNQLPAPVMMQVSNFGQFIFLINSY